MTIQITDTIVIRGEEYPLACEPLEHCWARRRRERPKFIAPHSACWRGYIASWEIAGGKLYLHDIEGTIGSPGGTIRDPGENSWVASLAELFPGESIPVFASWFTGTLWVREGELIEYGEVGYENVYERTRLFDVVEGEVTGERLDEPSPREVRQQRMQELLHRLKQRES